MEPQKRKPFEDSSTLADSLVTGEHEIQSSQS